MQSWRMVRPWLFCLMTQGKRILKVGTAGNPECHRSGALSIRRTLSKSVNSDWSAAKLPACSSSKIRMRLPCLVTLVCGEANRCSVTIAVWLITGNVVVSRLIRLKAISRRRGRTRPASRLMKALTVLLAMPRCRRMRRCMARCSISCSPSWRRAESAVSKKSEYIDKHGIPARMFNAVRMYAGRQGVGGAGVSACCSWIACGVG